MGPFLLIVKSQLNLFFIDYMSTWTLLHHCDLFAMNLKFHPIFNIEFFFLIFFWEFVHFQ